MKLKDKILDILFIIMMIAPFAACILLKVLTTPKTEGVQISGARIYLTIPMPVQDMIISEAQIVSVAVIIFVLALCLFMTRGLNNDKKLKRHIVAEIIVTKLTDFVKDNMGARFLGFAPFVAGIMAISLVSSLSSLLGLFPPTSDVNIIGGWALMVFGLITYYKFKGGAFNYVKGYFEPIPVFAPFNIIGEISTPVSMSFRHYGNVLSGVVISTLIAAGLTKVSSSVLGMLPGFLGKIPLFRVGVPAVLSLYFDLFSSGIQAFIFAILTMLYISNGFPEEEYEKRLKKKLLKNKKNKTVGA